MSMSLLFISEWDRIKKNGLIVSGREIVDHVKGPLLPGDVEIQGSAGSALDFCMGTQRWGQGQIGTKEVGRKLHVGWPSILDPEISGVEEQRGLIYAVLVVSEDWMECRNSNDAVKPIRFINRHINDLVVFWKLRWRPKRTSLENFPMAFSRPWHPTPKSSSWCKACVWEQMKGSLCYTYVCIQFLWTATGTEARLIYLTNGTSCHLNLNPHLLDVMPVSRKFPSNSCVSECIPMFYPKMAVHSEVRSITGDPTGGTQRFTWRENRHGGRENETLSSRNRLFLFFLLFFLETFGCSI